jgi:hypothetical protein
MSNSSDVSLVAATDPEPDTRAAGTEYFCDEPWTGLLSVETNLDVTFCPCYLQLKIGNLNDHSIHDIWNAAPLLELRASFQGGNLPPACAAQLCPVALGHRT